MSIFMGALGGLGEAAQNLGSTMMKAELDKESKQFESDLAVQREKTLLAYRNQAELEQIPLRAKATAGAELENAPTKAKATSIFSRQTAQDELDNAPTKAQAKLKGELAPEVTAAQARAEGEKAGARAEAERKETIAAGSDPNYVAAVKRLAQAKHIEGLGSVKQAALAQIGIDEKQKIAALVDEFEKPGTTPERKAQIKESLVVRGVIKPDESNTEKVTETEFDDMGNPVKKTERTQRRGAGGAPAGGGKPKLTVGMVVDGFVYQGGDPKNQANWVAKDRTSSGKVK